MEEKKEFARTLGRLAVGESCIIERVGNQRGALKRRLVDMGLTPGTEVKLVKVAPMGDPLELSLRGYQLSLRRADAEQIGVRPAVEKAAKESVSEAAYHLGGKCHGECGKCAMACGKKEDLEQMRRETLQLKVEMQHLKNSK